MSQAYTAIFEVGVKLGHVLWRKLQPEERAEADQNLVRITYDLLVDQRYDLAKNLLDFATGMKKFSSTEKRMTLVINRVQAYKWAGDNRRAQEILVAEDFTALQDQFQLAAAVLRDDFPHALKLIERMGNSGPNAVSEYREWPLYRELRSRADFAELFQRIFGQQLDVIATVPSTPPESTDDLFDSESESAPGDVSPAGIPNEGARTGTAN